MESEATTDVPLLLYTRERVLTASWSTGLETARGAPREYRAPLLAGGGPI